MGRCHRLIGLSLVIVPVLLMGGWLLVGSDAVGQKRNGLIVHEWGVFSVYEDEEAALQAMRAEWDGLPKSIYGVRELSRSLPYRGPVRKPVIYLHAPQAMTVDLKVRFTKGRAMVWYPATVTPSSESQDTRTLQWKLYLEKLPNEGNFRRPSEVQVAGVPDDHWFARLRNVDAAELFSEGSWNRLGARWDRERFVYYDGFVPAPQCLEVLFNGDKIGVRSLVDFPVHDLFVIDRRQPDKVRVARRDEVASREELADLAIMEVNGERWLNEAAHDLLGRLQKAGLHADEARGLVDTWKRDFFHGPQITLIYRLPQAEYDRMLPLTVTPAADKVVRVGLVHQIACDKALRDRISFLVHQLGAEDVATRERAARELQELKSVAYTELQQHRAKATDPELKARLDRVLRDSGAPAK
jgi:hypothetical protein